MKPLWAWLAPYARPHAPAYLAVALLAAAAAALALVPPLIARRLVDDVLVGRHAEALAPLLAAGLGVSLALAVASAAGGWLHARATVRVLSAVRADMLAHLLALPPPVRARLRAGDLVARLTQDVAEAQRAAIDTPLAMAVGLVAAGLAFAGLVWLDPPLAALALVAAPLVALVTAALRPWTLASARELRAVAGEGQAFMVDALAAATHAQGHAAEDRLLARHAAVADAFEGAVMRERLRAGVARAGPALVLGALAVALLGWGGWRVAAGELTPGTLLAFAALLWRFLAPLRGLAGQGLRLAGARAALERIAALRALAPLAPGGRLAPPPGAPAIALRDVAFAYEPGHPVLRGVTATLPAGAVTAIVGPSGAGKSTLLLLLLGLLDGWTGEVCVGGTPLSALDRAAWRRRVAWVAQDGAPLHASVAENLALVAPGATAAEMAAALEAVGLGPALATWPEGLATVVGERGLRLSGGQRQRLALAGALLRDADLLVLDEATSALDGLAEAGVWERVVAARAGRTTLLVTHRPALAHRADHVIALAGGRVVAEGPPASLAALAQAPGGAVDAAPGAGDGPVREARP